ncbi:MAG: 4Fe-4S dicluster domain-containing protein [Desulfobacterales bacterium]|nr:4Fe-4S dicluster domain-containing protein [Desulfobacterales bacterium]
MAKQLGLLFDLRRCIGCHTCVIACKVENRLEGNFSWIRVPTENGAMADLPQGQYPKLSLHWQPAACMHCRKPSCMEACPDEAITKRPDGIVLIDPDKCTGCQNCISACPYDAVRFNAAENVAEKCTLCHERVERDLLPFCVQECGMGAISFGDMDDPGSAVSGLVTRRKGYVLKPEEGNEPSNYYLDPDGC